jgi:hypothetical protein
MNEHNRTIVANALLDLARAVRRNTLSSIFADHEPKEDDNEDTKLRKRIIHEYGASLEAEIS